jgi:hypothetical protein
MRLTLTFLTLLFIFVSTCSFRSITPNPEPSTDCDSVADMVWSVTFMLTRDYDVAYDARFNAYADCIEGGGKASFEIVIGN